MKKRIIICVLIIAIALVMITPAFAARQSSYVYTAMYNGINEDSESEILYYFIVIVIAFVFSALKHLFGSYDEEDGDDTYNTTRSHHRRHRSHTRIRTSHRSSSSSRSSRSRSFRSSGRGRGGRSGGGGGGRR